MPCRKCPAAFLIEGPTRHDSLVLCRVESSDLGQATAGRLGPISRVRARTSPASFHGYCLGHVPDFIREIDLLGALARQDERTLALAARLSGADPDYTGCPSWQAECANRESVKLVDQRNTQRRVLTAGAA